jgi:hypothetical protein
MGLRPVGSIGFVRHQSAAAEELGFAKATKTIILVLGRI